MKKIGVVLVLVCVAILLSFQGIYALTCGSDTWGYSNRHMAQTANCASCCPGKTCGGGSTQCESGPRDLGCYSNSCKYYLGSRCPRYWTCNNVLTGQYRCEAGVRQVYTGLAVCGTWDNCGTPTNYIWQNYPCPAEQICTGEGICSSCTPKTCASPEYLGKCGELDDGCSGTITCECPSVTLTSWENESGDSVTSIFAGRIINLSIVGTKLDGVEVNYTIYDSTDKLVYNFSKFANSATSDSLNWTPLVSGTYVFNATLLTGGKSILSEVLLVISPCENKCTNNTIDLICTGNKVSHRKCVDGIDGCLNWTLPQLNKTCLASEYCSNGVCTTAPIIAASFCANYSTSSTCSGDSFKVAKTDVDMYLLASSSSGKLPSGGFCGTNNLVKSIPKSGGICNYTAGNCKCSWDTMCSKSFDLIEKCSIAGVNTENIGKCDISTVIENNCNKPGGKIIQKATAKWTVISGDKAYKPQPGMCESKDTTFDCPVTQRLPFFSWMNFALSLMIVSAIYSILLRKK